MSGHRYLVSFTGGQHPGAAMRAYPEPLTAGQHVRDATRAYVVLDVEHPEGGRPGRARAVAVAEVDPLAAQP